MQKNGKPKVLYVDDEPINTVLFNLNFKDDFDIVLSSSGEQGLELLETEPGVDVVLSDFKMPGLNGVEFIKEAHQRFGARPSIILSGYDRNEHITNAMDDGTIVAYLQKPMDKTVVLETIKGCINGKK